MKIIVTGGAGFIGSHLVEYLLNKGEHVICLDNFLTGTADNIKKFNSDPNFEFIHHDVLNPIFIEAKQVYNLACPASPVHYQLDRIKTAKINFMGAWNMLGLAHKNHARILQASTSEVYGDPKVQPQVESYFGNVNPISLRACYDEGKRVAESLFFDYHRQSNVDIRVARIFNTYGPQMTENDGRIISNFVVQALKNEPLTVYGDGLQTRSFCYVSDMVEGLYRLMNGNCIGPMNLGNPDEHTVLDMAQRIKAMTNSKSEIVFKPILADDPVKRRPSIDLAKKELGWEPKVKLEEGLKKTIEYFREKLGVK
ncbi:MAG TPA: UDP-glucuronic acid decarboxylase family protein [Candidatus Nanoarchaeia archaeon]|nr:UDP-glucuronic acid decarboxylase family protein [Candidatus Nanoarchaeia archaeon]